MSYNPTNWVNGETPINDSNLNHIEQGIKDVADLSDEQETKIAEIANNQIPEEYLQQSVDNYIANNQAGLATKTDVNNLDNKLSSEIVDTNSYLDIISTFTQGYFIDSKNGELIANEDYFYSDYIYIGNAKKLAIKCSYKYSAGIAFYTGKKTYIDGVNNADNVEYGTIIELDVPYGAKYIRISKNINHETYLRVIEYNSHEENKLDNVLVYIDGGVQILPKWEQGRIDNWVESDTTSAVRSALITLPKNNCEIQIQVSDTFKYQIWEYWDKNIHGFSHEITDSLEATKITTQFIRIVIFDTSWSGKINPNNVDEAIQIKMLTKEVALPQYYLDEIKTVRNSFFVNSIRNGFNTIFITDSHFEYNDASTHETYADSTIRQLKAIVELANTTNIDCIIHGGDLIHGATVGTEVAFDAFNRVVEVLQGANCPVLFVKGNHDDNTERNSAIPLTSVVSSEMWLKRLNDVMKTNLVHDTLNDSSSYYYCDFEKKKTRVIVLDAYDYPLEDDGNGNTKYKSATWNKFSDRQLEWLSGEALANVPSGYQIIISLHGVLIDGTGETKVSNASEVLNIINTYNSTNETKITNVIYGHTHSDIYSLENGVNFFCTGASKIANEEPPIHSIGYYSRPNRTKFTRTEALFDLYSLQNEKGRRIRFGAGESQIIG